MSLSACELQTQQAADPRMSVLIMWQKMGQVHIVKQLQRRRRAQNVKAAIKRCADEISLLSQVCSPLQPYSNELDQDLVGALDTSAASH